MARAEDTDVVRPDRIPQFVIKTELAPFNEWDTRVFPQRTPEPKEVRARIDALSSDAEGTLKYIDTLSADLGFGVKDREDTGVLWQAMEDLVEHIIKRKTEAEADERTTRKFQLEGRPFKSREWDISVKAHGRLHSNLAQAEALFPKVMYMAAQIATIIENAIAEMDREDGIVMQKAFDDSRMKQYEKIRKQLVDKRYRDRASRKDN